MDLTKLISGLDLRVVGDATGVRVCDITEDSRTVLPGSLFVARAGGSVDGRGFVAAACECGAVAVLSDTDDLELPRGPQRPVVLVSGDVPRDGAVLAERFYGNPTSRLALVGVTGTNGKTSVATMTRAVLEASKIRCGMVGGVEIDDGREIARAVMTTPPAAELSRAFASMVEHGCRAATMEVSSHALDQRRADGLAFDVAVFTNLSGDHLDYHKTPEAYFAAKRRLFSMLPEGGARVLNADDGAFAELSSDGARVCSAKGHPGATWRVRVESADLTGLSLSVETPLGPIEGRVAAVGAHNAMNVLQALASADAVCERLGMDECRRLEVLRRGIGAVRSPRGRLERVSGEGDRVTVFVDFAHTDDALANSLGAIRSVLPEGAELHAVFGCGGDKDKTKRPRMGRIACELADRVVVTSDNPRSEPPSRIVDEVLVGVPDNARARVTVHVDRGRAIKHAVLNAPDGAVIVLAGKGHETEQISCDAAGMPLVRHFDDAEEARAALRERRLRAGASA